MTEHRNKRLLDKMKIETICARIRTCIVIGCFTESSFHTLVTNESIKINAINKNFITLVAM